MAQCALVGGGVHCTMDNCTIMGYGLLCGVGGCPIVCVCGGDYPWCGSGKLPIMR